jgi:hypothetical protein
MDVYQNQESGVKSVVYHSCIERSSNHEEGGIDCCARVLALLLLSGIQSDRFGQAAIVARIVCSIDYGHHIRRQKRNQQQ